MTRRSKREIERAVDELGGDVERSAGETSLTEAQKDALRAVFRYRRDAYPNGGTQVLGADGSVSSQVLEEAIEEVDGRHVEPLEELFDWLEGSP